MVKIILLFFVPFIMIFQISYTIAEEEEQKKSKYAGAKTKKVKALGQAFGKKLKPINEFLAIEQWNDALKLLNNLDRPKKWKGHEYAHLYNTRGYVYYQLDQIDNALNSYLQVLDQVDAPDGLKQNTMRTVGQLYLAKDDCRNGIKYLKLWMGTQEIIGTSNYAILAQCYYQLEDFDNSLKNVEIAINTEEEKGTIGKENWYSIQRAIYYQRKNYTKVLNILEKMIINYPNIRYWMELGGIYSELENDGRRMQAYEIAFLQDGLTNESRLMGLAYMYLGADIPYRAGQIIAQGMKDNIIKRTEKNLQVAGSAYYQARSPEKALPFLEEASKKDKNGESYARLSGIFLDLGRYSDAIRSGKSALKIGNIKRPDLLKISMGTAYYAMRKYSDSIDILKTVIHKKSTAAKNRWIKHVTREIKRDKQLRASGIDLDKIYNRRPS